MVCELKKNRFCERNRIGVFGEAVRDLPAVSFTPRLFQTFPQSTPPPSLLTMQPSTSVHHPRSFPYHFTHYSSMSPDHLSFTLRESSTPLLSRHLVTKVCLCVSFRISIWDDTQLFHMSASSTVNPSNKCVVHFLLCRRNVCYKLRIGYSAWEKMNVFVCTL